MLSLHGGKFSIPGEICEKIGVVNLLAILILL